MRQLGASIRMKESGDVLEVEDDRGKVHTEKLIRERSGDVHNQLGVFAQMGWLFFLLLNYGENPGGRPHG